MLDVHVPGDELLHSGSSQDALPGTGRPRSASLTQPSALDRQLSRASVGATGSA